MQKSNKNLMHLGIDFWKDFGGFWKAKWSQVGTKIDQKSMPIAKCDFLKNRALAAAGARFLRFWGSKLGAKMDQKSFKKQGPRWNASWRGFLADFGAVLEPSWEQFGAMLTNSGYRKPSRQVCQVSQAKSVRSGQAAKAVDHFPRISLDKGGVPPTNKDVSALDYPPLS